MRKKIIQFDPVFIPLVKNLRPGVWPPEQINPFLPCKWQTRRIIQQDFPEHFGLPQWDEGFVDGTTSSEWYFHLPFYGGDMGRTTQRVYAKYEPGQVLKVRATNRKVCLHRFRLRILSVWIERLMEISEENIRAEGFALAKQFHNTWNGLYEKKISKTIPVLSEQWPFWKANPWVWVYEYMRVL